MNSADTPESGKRKSNRVSIWPLALKELRETLRDRRTIVTLILMPLIVYPILSLVFRTFLFSSMGELAEDNLIRYRIVLMSDWSEKSLTDLIATLDGVAAFEKEAKNQGRVVPESNSDAGAGLENPGIQSQLNSPPVEAPLGKHEILLKEPDRKDAEGMIQRGDADLVVFVQGKQPTAEILEPTELSLFYSEDLGRSARAATFLTDHIDLLDRVELQNRLIKNQLDSRLLLTKRDEVIKADAPRGSISFTTIIPLVLVLMTITGAVYPAIDLTAGERERGTLETLIATPVSRIRILVGKLIAVLTVAVLTASLNIIGMMSTVWAFQLDKLLMGDTPLTFAIFGKLFGLLILFATFFSALLLVVTSFARSFKEAQAYLIPIILLSFAPGLIAMTPGLQLEGPLAVCPMVNILLLARDLLEGNAQLLPAAIAIFSTIVYAAAAIGLAATIFGADSILYGSQGSWREMLVRPAESIEVAAPATSMLVLALLLPVNFVLIALMGKISDSVDRQLLLSAVFTTLSFFLLPLLVAWHQKIRLGSGFGIRWPGPTTLIAAILLGLVMWPTVMSMISLFHTLIDFVSGSEVSERWQQRLVKFSAEQAERFRQAPLPIVVLAMSIVPAICEEWFFRGMLQRSLLNYARPVGAIIGSAVAFGAFHTLSGSVVAFDRLIPTALMGGILGWIAWRTGSILPGIALHMFHNATIALLARYSPQLELLEWFPDSNESIPGSWTLTSVVATIALLAMIYAVTRKRQSSIGIQKSIV